jgi:hypothetical protein
MPRTVRANNSLHRTGLDSLGAGECGRYKTTSTIGTIRTPYKTKQNCPIQPLYTSGVSGRVKVLEQYADGLKDIETFSHIYLLYLFDRAGRSAWFVPPFWTIPLTASLPQGIRAGQTESGSQSSSSFGGRATFSSSRVQTCLTKHHFWTSNPIFQNMTPFPLRAKDGPPTSLGVKSRKTGNDCRQG